MKKSLDVLAIKDILEIHRKYQSLQSLDKTATWVQAKYGLNINRHDLSHKFKTMGLEVRPPNGREVSHWRDMTTYVHPYGKLAADMIQAAVEDFFGFTQGTGSKIDWMSACVFMLSDLWETCLGTLSQGANLTVDFRALPTGITQADVVEGAALYNRGYSYWVADE